MPWKVYKDGEDYCVHKVNPDGSKGKKVACHPTPEKAEAQKRALYANAKESMPPEIQEQERKDVTPADKKRAEKEYGNVEYADPENKKYPIDAKHVHAAWNYINKAKNAGKYSSAKLAKMKSRIIAAFKRVTGHAPPSVEEKPKEAEELDEATEKLISEWFDKMAECMTDDDDDIDVKTQQEAAKPAEKDEPPEEEKNETPEEEQNEVAAPQAVEHDHEHMHGTMTHSHPHKHDKEHGVDGQLNVKHDHPHVSKEGYADTSSNPSLIRSEKMTCASCKEQFDAPMEATPNKTMKCPKCGATIQVPEAKRESARVLVFGEVSTLREAEIDKARRTVNVTLIKPGWSVNGRYYSREVLAKAVPTFEGTKCFIDHPTLDDDRQRPERSVADIAGYYRNVKQADDGRLTAQLVMVGKRGDEMFPLVQETTTNKPDLIGLSINAMGNVRAGEAEGRQGMIVDELTKAFGTDIVTSASAGGRFERLMQSGDEMTTALLQSLSYEEWRRVSPDYEARIKKEMRTARKEELESAALKESAKKDETIQNQAEEMTRLQESVRAMEQKLSEQERTSATRVSELTADLRLMESGLPKEWCETLRPQLVAKPDEMQVLIEAERKKYFARVEPVTVTGAPAGDSTIPPIDPGLSSVLEALRVDTAILPRDDESPEEYAARKSKLTRR